MSERKYKETNEPPPAYNESTANPVMPIVQNIPFTNLDRGSLEQKFQSITRKYEINTKFAQKLQILESFKVVFVFDDSGSMNTVLQDSPLNNSNSLFKATRWDELQYFANISIEIASIFNPNGCDIYFLNRYPSPVRDITDSSQLVNYFRDKPQGFTMRNIDIVDDYKSEKIEVKRAQGQNFSFTFGDYVVKSLIGSIDPEMYNLDEKINACCNVL